MDAVTRAYIILIFLSLVLIGLAIYVFKTIKEERDDRRAAQ